jgi:trehalose/maltose hydrolase-like predicted phosphorylase
MYPSLLLHPDVAASVVDYRSRTLDGARINAEQTGYEGARFAWESANDGTEQTRTWAETRTYEQHITADMALAQWQYYLATGNDSWLANKAWPVLEGAADFWASRATPDGNGGYDINQVEGTRRASLAPSTTRSIPTSVRSPRCGSRPVWPRCSASSRIPTGRRWPTACRCCWIR